MGRLTIKSPSGLIHLKDNREQTLNNAIKKLSDYEDLDESNKIKSVNEFPCNVGDTVWCITSDQSDCILEPIECIVDHIVISVEGVEFSINSKASSTGWSDTFLYIAIPDHMNIRHMEDFGENVFVGSDGKERATAKLIEVEKQK